ncbi:MAG: malonyl-CoA synthase [Gammaproteobacteria bacterium]|nr:malonyl-CoA synthase [Gammaproteobacteria bacterium]MDX2460499.1 malonyl-CoA synthase [Gammaproteobacteria bacterium]
MTKRDNANLYALLSRRFEERCDTLAIETPGRPPLSYADVERDSARFANRLVALGAGPGDRVAVQVDKTPEALCLYLGCVRAGLIYLPLNTGYPARELEYFFRDAEPRIIVCRPQDLDMIGSLAERCGVAHVTTLGVAADGSLMEGSNPGDEFDTIVSRKDDIAAILYTSGTTGKPKGAALSHDNLGSNAVILHETWGFCESDVLLHALPLFHTHGLFVACHCSLLNATPMLLLPKFDPNQVMALLPRTSVFMGVPTFYTRLLANADFGRGQCAHMRLFVSGSAPLLEQTHSEFFARTGHRILERYGMTECGMSTSNPLNGERKAGTVGLPLAGVSLRIVDDAGTPVAPGDIGQIEFKGPNVFQGYWRMPEKTAEEFSEDGYFRSGDLGELDEDGYVSIVGRDKDLIISGGYNVYPKEVELCIDQLDGVSESAVIGIPDADFGERVIAVVVADSNAPDEEEIIAALRPLLASYKLPKQVSLVDALPRNAMGKVQKNILRDLFITNS